MQLGWRYPDRKKFLEDLLRVGSKKTFPIMFQGKQQYLEVHAAPIELPRYRLDNGRTIAAQSEYLSRHRDLKKDFFTENPESESAHKAQHEILSEMVKEKGLLDYFRSHKQIEPLILTTDGYVVNGNRRICAMRLLLQQDVAKYGHFKQVDVVVLPPAQRRDIDELEGRLQVIKDIKADYTWIALALMLRRRKGEHSYGDDELASLYDLSKAEVDEHLLMLTKAEVYLQERGKPGEYLSVGDEYAFQQLIRRQEKIKEPSEKEFFEKASFALIDGAKGGRLYQFIPEVAKRLNKVIEAAIKHISPKSSSVGPGDQSHDDLLGGSTSFAALEEVIDAFGDEAKRAELRDVIVNTIQHEKLLEEERKRKNFVLDQVQKSHTALSEALNAINSDTPTEGISKQLDAIQRLVLALREKLDEGP